MKKRIASIGAFVAWAGMAWGGNIEFSASVDQTTLTMNDTLTLNLIVKGGARRLPQPTLPSLPGFRTASSGQSQSFNFVNGEATSELMFSYSLSPQGPGKYTIPSFSIEHEGKTYSTDPMEVTVVSGNAPPPVPRRSGGSGQNVSSDSQALFVTTSVDKNTVMVGEQVTLTFRFYHRLPLLSQPRYSPADTTGFLTEDLPPQRNFSTTVNGMKYQVVELKTALFPTGHGKITIGPAALAAQVQNFQDPFGDDFFRGFFRSPGSEVTLRSDPILVTVSPLPTENRPAGFQGDVGRYSLSSRLDKTLAHVGEPVTLTVTVSGEGNIKTLSTPPLPTLEGFRTYETLSALNIEKKEGRVRGFKVFTTVMKPEVSGNLQIPSLIFRYFDPDRQAYATATSTPLKIQVEPAAGGSPSFPVTEGVAIAGSEVKELGRDIRFLKIKNPLKPVRLPWIERKEFPYIQMIPGFLCLVVWGSRRVGQTGLKRLAPSAQRRALRALAHVPRGPDGVGTLRRIFLEYLGTVLGVPGSGLTVEVAEERLRGKGISEKAIHMTKDFWKELDQRRYTPTSATDTEALVGQMKEWIISLAPTKSSWGRRSGNTLALCLFTLFAVRWLSAADSRFQKGLEAYQAKDYSVAKDAFEELAQSGQGGVGLSYNLGNTYYRLGQMGRARLWYERALLELPGDDDVLYNRELVQQRVGDTDDQGDLWRRWVGPLWAVATLFNIVFFGFVLTGLFWENEPVWWGRWLGGIVFGIALLTAITAQKQASVRLGVVVESRAEARTGPSAQEQVGFVAPEGHRVVLLDSLSDWVQIGVPAKGLKGWVPRASVEPIRRERGQ